MQNTREPRWVSLNISKRWKLGMFEPWIMATGGYGWEVRLGLGIGDRVISLVLGDCWRDTHEKNIQIRLWRHNHGRI